MKYKPDIHHRRSIRLKGYDYSSGGAYFVTISTQNRACFFGDIVEREMVLNDAGRMLQTVLNEMPMRFQNVELDQYLIMPNHFHAVIVLQRKGESCIRPFSNDYERGNSGGQGNNKPGDHKDRPYGTLRETLGRNIQALKSITTHEYIIGVKQHGWPPFSGKLWQRNYYEHIIRDEDELNRIRQYIRDNPLNWETDEENPDRVPTDTPGSCFNKIFS